MIGTKALLVVHLSNNLVIQVYPGTTVTPTPWPFELWLVDYSRNGDCKHINVSLNSQGDLQSSKSILSYYTLRASIMMN